MAELVDVDGKPVDVTAAFEAAMANSIPEAPKRRHCGARRMLLLSQRFGVYLATADYCDRPAGHEGRHSSFWRT